MNLKVLLGEEIARTPMYEISQWVLILTPVHKTKIKGQIVSRKLNDILQKWFYSIDVPEYAVCMRGENEIIPIN